MQAAADGTGEMVTLLAPVDAVPDERAPWRDGDAEVVEEGPAVRCEPVVDRGAVADRSVPRLAETVTADEESVVEQSRHESHSETTREVVVTGPRLAQRSATSVLTQRAHRSSGSELREDFEKVSHSSAGEPIVAVPAADLDDQQSTVDEFGQVAAGGGGSDSGLGGQSTGGQRSPVVESHQQPCS